MSTLIHDANHDSTGDNHTVEPRQTGTDRRHHDAFSSGPDSATRRQHRMQHELEMYGIERRTPMIKLDYLLAAVLLLVLFLVWSHQ